MDQTTRRPSRLPGKDVLGRLLAEGLTQTEIAEEFGVHRQAVNNALSRHGMTMPRKSFKDRIPWRVADEHRNVGLLRDLRTAVRVEDGMPVPPTRLALYEGFLKRIAPSREHPQGLVVGYGKHRTADGRIMGGFYLTPRTDEDEWYISERTRPHQ